MPIHVRINLEATWRNWRIHYEHVEICVFPKHAETVAGVKPSFFLFWWQTFGGVGWRLITARKFDPGMLPTKLSLTTIKPEEPWFLTGSFHIERSLFEFKALPVAWPCGDGASSFFGHSDGLLFTIQTSEALLTTLLQILQYHNQNHYGNNSSNM